MGPYNRNCSCVIASILVHSLLLYAREAACTQLSPDRVGGESADHLDGNLGSEWIEKANSSSLRQVFLVHRHGDRSPYNFPPEDALGDEPFWQFHGKGQLTNRGKARVYLLGKLMRKRYDDFLGKSVNKHLLLSRSSGTLRCFESAQTFLAAFMDMSSPESVDGKRLNWDYSGKNSISTYWQPIPVQSLPLPIDGMLAQDAKCKEISKEHDIVINFSDEVKQFNETFEAEARLLNRLLGFTMTKFRYWVWAGGNIEVESTYFKHKMHPELLASHERILEASDRAMGFFQSTIKARRLRAGLLMNDIITNMLRSRNSSRHGPKQAHASNKLFFHYASHEVSVVVLLGMLEQWQVSPRRPDFAASVVIELHQDDSADEWFVRLFYMPQVPGELHELRFGPCETGHPANRCTLDRLVALMRPYLISDWQQWMRECDNDLSSVDPFVGVK